MNRKTKGGKARFSLAIAVVGALLLAGLSACASSSKEAAPAAGNADKGTVRIGYQKYASVNIMKSQGDLEKSLQAQGYKVQWTEFPGGPQLLEALNVGSIDLGHTGESPPIFAQAAGTPLVYLAQEPPSPEAEAILVPANSPIQKVSDLKGKKVALNKGSNVHYLLVKALEANGLAYKDIEPVFLPPADARVAFERGSVDAWVIWEPFFAAGQSSNQARILADGKGLVKNYEFYLASRSFGEGHKDVIETYLKELEKTDKWAKANQAEVAKLLSPGLGIDTKVLELALSRRGYGIERINDTVLAEQQKIADVFLKLELIPKAIQVKEAVLAK